MPRTATNRSTRPRQAAAGPAPSPSPRIQLAERLDEVAKALQPVAAMSQSSAPLSMEPDCTGPQLEPSAAAPMLARLLRAGVSRYTPTLWTWCAGLDLLAPHVSTRLREAIDKAVAAAERADLWLARAQFGLGAVGRSWTECLKIEKASGAMSAYEGCVIDEMCDASEAAEDALELVQATAARLRHAEKSEGSSSADEEARLQGRLLPIGVGAEDVVGWKQAHDLLVRILEKSTRSTWDYRRTRQAAIRGSGVLRCLQAHARPRGVLLAEVLALKERLEESENRAHAEAWGGSARSLPRIAAVERPA